MPEPQTVSSPAINLAASSSLIFNILPFLGSNTAPSSLVGTVKFAVSV